MSEESNLFLGRQPILNRNQELVAFELLFRSDHSGKAHVTDDMVASSKVIDHTLELGLESVLGGKLGFINLNGPMLMSNSIEFLPHKQIVLELLETIEMTPLIIERCRYLKSRGFKLALDDFVEYGAKFDEALSLVDIVKIDIAQLDFIQLKEQAKKLKKWPVKLLAEKVETREQVDQCFEYGFDYFQGYFFAKPVLLTGKQMNPNELSLLRLLGLICGDAELSEVEETFKQNPDLNFKLLRMINSAAFSPQQLITSPARAIMVLGRRQLQRWIQLLIFANKGSTSSTANPLLQLAATRGKLMELLAQRSGVPTIDFEDNAFMTGVLSLLDTLMGIPLTEILTQLKVSEDIKQALLERRGILGSLLCLVEELERNNREKVESQLNQLPGLSLAILNNAHAEALRWANSIE